jgi:hypothetical protein
MQRIHAHPAVERLERHVAIRIRDAVLTHCVPERGLTFLLGHCMIAPSLATRGGSWHA